MPVTERWRESKQLQYIKQNRNSFRKATEPRKIKEMATDSVRTAIKEVENIGINRYYSNYKYFAVSCLLSTWANLMKDLRWNSCCTMIRSNTSFHSSAINLPESYLSEWITYTRCNKYYENCPVALPPTTFRNKFLSKSVDLQCFPPKFYILNSWKIFRDYRFLSWSAISGLFSNIEELAGHRDGMSYAEWPSSAYRCVYTRKDCKF